MALRSTTMKLLFFPLKLAYSLMTMYEGAYLQKERGEMNDAIFKVYFRCTWREVPDYSANVFSLIH